jgi:dihydropteroate synthase
LHIRNHELVFGRQTFIMGVINVTPDSFSQDGLLETKDAVSLALEKIKQGAQIIDIGGQSTRPGYEAIDEETEISRIIPVIKALRQVSDVIISVDTFSAKVAAQAIAAGADIINSICGLTDELLALIKDKPVPIVIMHNKSEAIYPNGVVNEVTSVLAEYAERALAAGLAKEQIILDPGIGFGKTADHNIEIISQFAQIGALGFSTLIGTSRKSTIGKLTEQPVEARVFGTAATIAFAIAQGVDIVRVHDVQEIADVVKVSDALVRNWRPANWES